jgi:hypothetical protein
MSIKNKKLKIMNEEWREAVMTEKCYFCHFFSIKVIQSLEEENSRMVVLTKEAFVRKHTYIGSTLSVLYKTLNR